MNEETAAADNLIFPRLHSFLESMRAIGDAEDFVNESARSLNSVEDAFVVQARRLYPGLDEAIHRRAAEYIHPKIHQHMNGMAELKAKKASQKTVNSWTASWERGVKEKFLELTGDADYFHKYARVWNTMGKVSTRSKLLRNSLLMAAVSDFEVLVSGLVRAFLALRPEILRSTDTRYTFSDLEPFSTLDDFRRHCAENVADGLLRGGFDEWMDWFQQKRKIKVAGVTEDANSLVEIFQRRHLLVHNGGVVNRYYRSKVSGDSLPHEGEVLEVSRTYLQQAIDELTVAGVKLALSLVMKIDSSPEKLEAVDHEIGHIAFDFLTAESWQIAYDLNEWHLSFASKSSTQLIAKINMWVAQKNLNGSKAIALEVEGWDTATLSARYRLAKYALLDQHEKAYELVKSLLDSKDLEPDEWRGWPLLEGVRSYEAKHVEERSRLHIASFRDSHHDE